MKELPIEEFFNEIMQAIENGVAEANTTITDSTTVQPLRDVLLHTGEAYAGYIGKAIVEVFKEYTEDGK